MALAAQASAALTVQGMAQGVLSSGCCARGTGCTIKTAGFEFSSAFGTFSALRTRLKVRVASGNNHPGPSWVQQRAPEVAVVSARAVAMQDSLTDEDSEGIGEMGLGQRELKDYPPGLHRYETMTVLRPDISEEQRLALTQRYEEAIIAGGGLDVEMFNRGMQPLAYNINAKNMSGVSNRYLDGIYLLFTYVTKPESQLAVQKRLNADDDIIRATTFRLKV